MSLNNVDAIKVPNRAGGAARDDAFSPLIIGKKNKQSQKEEKPAGQTEHPLPPSSIVFAIAQGLDPLLI